MASKPVDIKIIAAPAVVLSVVDSSVDGSVDTVVD